MRNDRNSAGSKRVLITGATGYIGRRLAARLLEEGKTALRLFVRNASKLDSALRLNAEVVEGDTFDEGALSRAATGVDTAYYLVHSMGAGAGFPELDRRSARNFLEACLLEGVSRIVYLGGLGERETASRHLLSRLETGDILSRAPQKIQTVWFRAGIIIGSGSASFEIVRHLVQKLPVMITPRFVRSRTQPIFVGDVLDYLVRAKDIRQTESVVVDIGSEAVSFREMLIRTAGIMGLKRFLIPVPVFTPRLSSYWLVLMTPVPYRVAGALVGGLKSESLVRNDAAARIFPDIKPLGFDEAVRRALDEIAANQVISAWCDSSGMAACDVKGRERIAEAVFTDVKVFPFEGGREREVFDAAESIGGVNGWFAYNWLWKVRGFADKLVGGPGLSRGRRDPLRLRIGDSLDFWKVVDYRDGKRILLANQMKVPGEAWLEISVADGRLLQTAHFLPRGVWGRLYWILMKPFHALIFGGMGRGIIRKALTSDF